MKIVQQRKEKKRWGGHGSYTVYMTHKFGHALQRKARGNFDAFVALVKERAKRAKKEMMAL